MVFWNDSRYTLTTQRFESHIIKKLQLSIEKQCTILTHHATMEERAELRLYVKNYFGNPPHTPVLDIPEEDLIKEHDYIFLLREKSNIIGTIRYHYIGQFDKEPIYVVDCFCIHPRWRKKGVGDYLLTELHVYSNQHGRPHCVFLKEGQRLSIWHSPFYTGVYAYRELSSHVASPHVVSLSTCIANKLLDIHLQFNPNLFIIRNPSATNQYWKLYKKSTDSILMCVQDTYQRVENKKIGWITAWIESPYIQDEFREEAVLAVSDMLYPMFDYVWINQKWINQRSINQRSNHLWKTDGTFHWYLYQWSTNCTLERSYALLQ